MIAVKVQHNCGLWHAWMGVNVEHIRKDVSLDGGFLSETLVEIPLEDIQHMDCYLDARGTIQTVERQYQGQEASFIPGTTAYSLGVLVPEPV